MFGIERVSHATAVGMPQVVEVELNFRRGALARIHAARRGLRVDGSIVPDCSGRGILRTELGWLSGTVLAADDEARGELLHECGFESVSQAVLIHILSRDSRCERETADSEDQKCEPDGGRRMPALRQDCRGAIECNVIRGTMIRGTMIRERSKSPSPGYDGLGRRFGDIASYG